ncbi:Disease resistance protein [Melia azedarach]|uniref:Disease resistance protein n=1 Tax=Melia azedarach TaxID=155640 RepID=A0ACC1YD29_MELAZ|nr:Disease resistance protein [Melia azedarach]
MELETIEQDLGTIEERKNCILTLLKGGSVSTIILVGCPGTGKTWIAREISECAISDGLCYATLWLSVTQEYKTKTKTRCLIEEAIARQILSQSSFADEWEEEEENAEKKEQNKESTDQMVLRIIEEKKDKSPGRMKYLLLVLDDCGSKMNESELRQIVLQDFADLLPSVKNDHLLTIISRTIDQVASNTQQNGPEVIRFPPLSLEGSLTLLCESIEKKVPVQRFDQQLFKDIAKKTMGFPAAITMIAEALKYIAGEDSDTLKFKRALENAANYEIAAENINPIIYCAYEMLPSTVLKCCFWHSIKFSSKYGGVHYNVLISHWILEGCFDPIHHIEKAYLEAHNVLMDLIDRGMLKIQEDNIIVAEGAAFNMINCCLEEFGEMSSLGLPSMLRNEGGKDLGRIALMDGMIKTLCNPKNWQEVSTLLIGGSRLSREVNEKLFHQMKVLKALAIFNPRLKSLVSTTSKPGELLFNPEKLLVLRNCDMLEDITPINKLKNLVVLEISGASSLKKIPDKMFDEMTQLQSLNLSGCQMESLPEFSKPSKLRFLILKGCSCLRKLPSLKELLGLEIIDLSGATSFSSFPQEDLSYHQHLQMIDLSYTQIARLPKFLDLKHLSRVLLRGCHKVRMLPSLKQLQNLQILDLSEVKFSGFHEGSKKEDSATQKLSLIPTSLSQLYLSRCSELKQLPSITELKRLELLDASDASNLAEIKDSSFEHLKYLHSLDLSNTKVEKLPSLSNLGNLRRLCLKNCSLLEKLPEMMGLVKLEVLDLSGCSKLVELPNLTVFPKLEILDISRTGIKKEILEPTTLKVIREVDEDKTNKKTQDGNRGMLKPSILLNDSEILQILKENPELQEVCIKQISFPFLPLNEQAVDGDHHNHYNSDEVMFSDFYLRAKSFNKDAKFLEIRGFKSFSAGLKDNLKNIVYISLVEHISMKSMSDLDAGSLSKMKGCWMARCVEMETIFCERTDVKLVAKLEILWVSNLPKLGTLFNQKLQSENFENLKHLHLDCCPKLKYIFSSSQIPENLQVLEIKFCDSLETVLKSSGNETDKCTLSKLHTLLLFDLPELTSIGFTMPNPKIWECPKLRLPPTIKIVDGHMKFIRSNQEEIQ